MGRSGCDESVGTNGLDRFTVGSERTTVDVSRPQLSDASLEHASHLLSVTRVIEKCHGYAFLSVTRPAKTRHMPYL
jgi:hypothetical protein